MSGKLDVFILVHTDVTVHFSKFILQYRNKTKDI